MSLSNNLNQSKAKHLKTRRLSVIIPTLNEELCIDKTIQHAFEQAKEAESLEVIVVDAGSKDQTVEKAKTKAMKVISDRSLKGKKYQSMQVGVENGEGEVVLFLDADTLVPKHFDKMIFDKIQSGYVGGAFDMSFPVRDWKYKLIVWLNQIRYRIDGLYFGDQAIFCAKDVLERCGGVPTSPLMESSYLCRQLRKEGKLALIKKSVITSPRRFQENGFWRVTLFDLKVWLRFLAGLPIDRFASNYWAYNNQIKKR